MRFDVYLDESGTHDGARALSIAGYMATPEKWAAFSVEWQRTLDEWGLPWFHMKGFANGVPPYDAWNRSARELMFQRLVAIVNSHAYASVSCSVPVAEVNAVLPPRLKAEIGAGGYGIAFTALFMEVARFLRSEPAQLAAYIAGTGVKGRGRIVDNVALGKRKREWIDEFRVASLRFEDPRHFLPLQAADILAYETHHCMARETGLDPRPMRHDHMSALAGIQRRWIRLEGETLRNFAKALEIKVEYEANRRRGRNH